MTLAAVPNVMKCFEIIFFLLHFLMTWTSAQDNDYL